MVDYLGPIHNTDDSPTKLAKALLAIYKINDNINYPVSETVEFAGDTSQVNTSQWSVGMKRGIWNRIAPAWKTRAEEAGVRWGTEQKGGRRDAQISSTILTVDGRKINCRPLEYLGSSPCKIPFNPTQVLALTAAAECLTIKTGKAKKWVAQTVEYRLRITERLVRASISTSFASSASVFPDISPTLISHVLLPPMSSISGIVRFETPKSSYDKNWPEESARSIRPCTYLQSRLDCGNDQRDTLVLLAHQAYNHIGWLGWAELMLRMSNNSMLGIAYIADHDVKYGRDRSFYGTHGLDYIIAISNATLQSLSQILSNRLGQDFPTNTYLKAHSTLSNPDIRAIVAINERAMQEPVQGAEALQGGCRYPGEAVALDFAYDEIPN